MLRMRRDSRVPLLSVILILLLMAVVVLSAIYRQGKYRALPVSDVDSFSVRPDSQFHPDVHHLHKE